MTSSYVAYFFRNVEVSLRVAFQLLGKLTKS